ncbi:zinc finger protein 567-like [Periophthalmus magnuspinnatus]|uniref:zinc finger protein 567-like n=1 Tax=Periophthalmus magnuspinnatus TaxID=409849 RepID=UPI0024367196|nr:zinc finger protein 567-like [Periophthalmus magnuspinnatus]
MSRGQNLRALVQERLTAAAEDIYVLFERITAEYEEELCRCKQENERKQRLLDSTLSPRVVLTRAGVHMSSLSPGFTLKQEIPETPQIKEETEEEHIKQEEEELHMSVPEFNDGCVKTEESSLPQRKETDHRRDTQREDISSETWVHREDTQGEDTQGEDISSETCVHREDTQGEDIGSETLVHPETERDTEHSSDIDSDEDWRAPIDFSAAQMETEADGDLYNHVQIRAKSTTAPNSGLSPKYKFAPETRATVDNGDMSGTAEGAAGEKHQCSVGKKRFDLKNNLERVDRREKPYSCYVCEKAFTQKIHLTLHMRTHTGDKPYSCCVCEKAFTQKSSLTDHMRTHTGDKPYSCSVCEKAFSQKITLTLHMRTHTGDKPYSCSVCEKAFTQKITLTLHMRTHTGDKPYSCSVCEKAFTVKSYLTLHMRTHTGDGTYSCSVCEKAFTRKSYLPKHMRTHTGDKPYSCSVCEKAFSLKCTLRNHMRTHTGDKPYSCSVCNKRFTFSSGLKTHMRTHSEEK